MVADADGEALPGSGKHGERAIVYLQEFAGVFEEGCAPRRKLHVPGAFARRAGQPSLSSSRFSFKLTAACVVRMASAARVRLPSSAMRMKAWTASKSRGRSIISGHYRGYQFPKHTKIVRGRLILSQDKMERTRDAGSLPAGDLRQPLPRDARNVQRARRRPVHDHQGA